jgi:hypothetical protein
MWKSQRLLSVPLHGNRCPSLEERLVRVGKWMQMLRILFFRIPSDDRVYTVLTAKKISHTLWKITFILVYRHSLRRLIPVDYRGLFDIKGETRIYQASVTKDVAYVWTVLQLQVKKSCYPRTYL